MNTEEIKQKAIQAYIDIDELDELHYVDGPELMIEPLRALIKNFPNGMTQEEMQKVLEVLELDYKSGDWYEWDED